MKTTKSRANFKIAQLAIPGGVNSPVRAFRSVGGDPLFIKKAKGATVEDVDGNTFIDYVLSWGPMILGHANPGVLKAIIKAAQQGTSYGAPCQAETDLANVIIQAVPSIEQVRLVNSGTEAVMSAIRLARAYTKRDKILKFDGCYHGHADHLLVKAGSGIATLGIPDTPGVPKDFARHTLTAPFNDIVATEKLIHKHAKDLAAIIVEPVAGNMGVIPPTDEFLPWLRMITQKYEIVLIFDEVITGFRVHFGGAQALYKVLPDLTCLGKIIGGGLPIGAYGGRKDIMQMIAPAGPVYQAGTLSGNPVAVAAGLETLRQLKKPGVYKELEKKSKTLAEGLGESAKAAKIPYYQTRVGSMLGGFFTEGPVTDYTSAKKSNTVQYGKFFHGMLKKGVYLAPSQFEAMLLSTTHSDSMIKQTISAARNVFKIL
ncbi:MAG: glutamate-1-semialdehyde 2,1-aminomutase [Nitrospirota bacterium]|nr:glutamate-1-semialdehyde 2,1-aminomutase [Nitrospirota bacterium]MDH5586302.1 glutamate-1-semialdehyde 2,1-aminomutase [Nitrospirota bacterium]MDH5774597.1 glutamate-1-semialdehyde 2,1-aminomutase [Nitrospirota bacterium]